RQQDIAIIGLVGRFPEADDLEAFWRTLRDGRESITFFSDDELRASGVEPELIADPNYVRANGVLSDVTHFDSAFFGIAPAEADVMDPQHRLFLEAAWRALEDAGYRPGSLRGSRAGVFAGVSTSDYRELLERHGQAIEAHTPTGTLHAMLPNRVSFLLDLRGPSETIDTACSSSLVAVHRAIQALRRGECELALAGGVNALLSPRLFIAFDRAGMLAPDGRCKTFDRRADGYVRGEGAGVVVLKPLSRALADGDHIHGVLRSCVVNHGGQAQSLTAPSARAQAELLVEAIGAAEVDPETIGYIEAHGTGTALGDPIEVNALKKAFAELAMKRGRPLPAGAFCGLGSIKSHIGHLETAAGVAGLIHALLALRHRRLPALHDFRELNPYIELADSPFFIVDQARDWPEPRDSQGRPAPRRAGVSSFGFGGVNAHCVVEEYQPALSRPTVGPVLVPLSARTPEQLQAVARRLLDHLATSAGRAASLADIAYTLQVGRESHEHRLAVLCASPAELGEKLTAFLAGGPDMPGLWRGVAAGRAALAGFGGEAEDRDYLRALVANGKLARLAALWAGGVAIAWEDLYEPGERRRVPLPGYPFERRRHWFGGSGLHGGSGLQPTTVPVDATALPNRGLKPTPTSLTPTSSIPTGLPPLGLWQPAWRLVEPDGAKLPAMPHTLVVRHARDFGLARALAAETGRIAFLGRGWRRAGERYRAIDLAREADYAALLEDIPAPFDVYFLGGLARAPFDPADMAAFDRAQDTGPLALLSLVRALHASGRLGQVGRLVVVTSGVYSADGEGAGTNPAAGGLAGLCRVLHSEYPDLPLSCVDLDEAELAADPAAIARRLAEAPGLPAVELALRAGRWRRRVVEPLANLDTVTTDGLPVRPGGVYLIAGGAGGLGLIFSRHLAERGGTRLVWLGRRAADAVVERSIREVQAAGGEV
ncbi:MAG: type I polyketide synthase, partial [Methylomagnum sp.]